MQRKIIAFTGHKQHGKDTAAEVLIKEYGYTKVAFADPLRQVCKVAFGLTDDEMLSPDLKEKVLERWPFKSPRYLLQFTGTELFRNNFPGVWVNAWQNAIAGLGKVVVTDCRFYDEEHAVHKLGGIIVKIINPYKPTNDTHESEAYINQMNADRVIINDFPDVISYQAWVREVLADVA